MDTITLALAKSYTDSSQLGRVESKAVVILPEETVSIGDSGYAIHEFTNTVTADTEVVAVIDGVRFETRLIIDNTSWVVGNKRLISTEHADTGEDWCINYGRGNIYLLHVTPGEHTFYLEIPEQVKTIDQKFIPPLDSLTLNGADGKQYKLSVDESGQLMTEAIT